MNKQDKNIITVYEHEAIRVGNACKGELTPHQLESLQRFNGVNGVPYFKLIHNGIKFCEFVGVLQVGKLTIKVLPKIDKGLESEKDTWSKILIDMLRKVGTLEVATSSETNLKIKSNSILDLYIESFLIQTEKLIHQGLIKKYRKVEDNCTALKGKIVFQKHLAKNIIHKENFFIKYTIYDHLHTLNQILYKTLQLIKTINTNIVLQSKVSNLLMNFPEVPDIKVSEELFDNIVYTRKNESYRSAILISKLLLLNYNPDINSGRNHVIALMFDMNLLWEKFVYTSLRKYFKEGKVEQQVSKAYWKLQNKQTVKLRPDVILIKDDLRYVVDTKWKMPFNNKPGYSDLQQMYAYTKYFESKHTLLCYPGKEGEFISGYFFDENTKTEKYQCSVLRISLDVSKPINKWQEDIANLMGKHLKHQ